ncbi:MAG: extradiol ring-cleavage dioxygenase [Candidatus Rokubacteria bacterium]|nr:extradiol ring-cleavage dioxygenase [Candidatus Rokubacteria bacterium]
MGEILGLGMTHVPLLAGRDEDMTRILRRILQDPGVPELMRDPQHWPPAMRKEWGADEGLAAARRHREQLVAESHKVRRALDDFAPDVVVIWGDDQYENFQDDIIPPFCVLAYDAIEHRPWAASQWKNIWNEPADTLFTYKGHRQAAKALVTGLLEEGFDLSYAYKPLHHPLGHAFMNTLLFLDYDRQGLPYPVIPFAVNCYGRRVVAQHGTSRGLSQAPTEDQLDPPSPPPWRCFDLGRAVARVAARSPWRVALIASSSWSHAFLTFKHHLLYPDVPADRALYDAMRAGDYPTWRQTPLASIEASGQQEMLNWMCLIGAMAELDRKPREAAFVESWIFNSNKVFAIFP